jgi:predicted RNA-binding Zn-ribbon protein involved in translation (DUF1610 family)
MLEKSTCAECGSEYYTQMSALAELCPNCAHHLYGHQNCDHEFKNDRCEKCYWDGSVSDFIKDRASDYL